MNILIIGNGFDLAHGLPTKYSDFLKYINIYMKHRENIVNRKKIASLNITKEEQEYLIHFGNLYDKEKKRDVLDELYELSINNIWLDYFQNIYEERSKIKKNGWIDFENEISQIIQTLDNIRHTLLKQESNEIKLIWKQLGSLAPVVHYFYDEQQTIINRKYYFNKDKIVEIKQRLLSDLNKLTRCLEIYLVEYIKQIPIANKLPGIKNLRIDKVLSFNYTNTFQRVYDVEKTVEYDFIHGEAKLESNVDECNIILGIDEYLKNEDKDNDNEFIYFKKFFQRIYKRTGSNYRDWEKEAAKSDSNGFSSIKKNLYIIGHSLDITDKDILSWMINMEGTKTTIYYHNKETLGNLINNLVKILGEDELITKVHGSNASIIFEDQKKLESLKFAPQYLIN